MPYTSIYDDEYPDPSGENDDELDDDDFFDDDDEGED